MSIPTNTTGLGVPTQIVVDSESVTLSLSGTTTHQISANLEDAGGNVQTGTALTLTAAGNASGNSTVYSGTFSAGGSNAYVGFVFVVAGFVTHTVNNGTFICTASTTSALTLDNAAGVAETHAATATSEDSLPLTFLSYEPGAATVSTSGLITAVAVGWTNVEVSYPAFGNTIGDIVSSGNPMNGLPIEKIYTEIAVQVTL